MRLWIVMFAVLSTTLGLLRAQGDVTNQSGMPAAEAVLRRVMQQAMKDDAGEREFAQSYSYIRTRVTENRDAKGALQSREEKKDLRKPAATSAPPPPATPTNKPAITGTKGAEVLISRSPTTSVPRGRAFDRTDFILNGDLLNRFAFKVAGREIINGRPSLLLEFNPVAKPPAPKNLKERFINKAAGRLWIDEDESVLVRGQLHLTERVSVAGGLLASISRFQYEFNRERTSEGLWFTRTTQWHLEGREVVLYRNINYTEEKSDVRKVTAVK